MDWIGSLLQASLWKQLKGIVEPPKNTKNGREPEELIAFLLCAGSGIMFFSTESPRTSFSSRILATRAFWQRCSALCRYQISRYETPVAERPPQRTRRTSPHLKCDAPNRSGHGKDDEGSQKADRFKHGPDLAVYRPNSYVYH